MLSISLLKAIFKNAKHRSKFAALSPVVMVTAAGKMKTHSGGYMKQN
jgi:hypothetical protein